MTCQDDFLTAKKRAFVAALAAGMTQAGAAAKIGVKERTARRWFADPLVRAALKEAQGDALADAVRALNGGARTALDVLLEVMRDKSMPGGVRCRAADSWLSHAARYRELLDLEERVSELERRAAER